MAASSQNGARSASEDRSPSPGQDHGGHDQLERTCRRRSPTVGIDGYRGSSGPAVEHAGARGREGDVR